MVIFPTFAVPHVPLKTGFMVVTTAVVFLHALPTGGVVLHCLEVPPGGESLRKHKVTESQGGYSLLADPAKCSRHDMSWSCTDLAFLRLVFSCFLEGFSASKSEISCLVQPILLLQWCFFLGEFFAAGHPRRGRHRLGATPRRLHRAVRRRSRTQATQGRCKCQQTPMKLMSLLT